jgi:pheromone shutdown-related protein TraB
LQNPPYENDERRLIIVGTAHVSKKSIEEVEEVILTERPDAVAVELDQRRYLDLVKHQKPEISLVDVIKKGEAHLMLFQLLLSYFQRKMGEKFGVKPGEEMLKAIECAKKVNADVLLIDRDITITFKRFWDSLSILEKIKLFFSLIGGLFSKEEIDVEKMLEEDVLSTMVSEFQKVSPNAARVLLDERDAFMAGNLMRASSRYSKIVAVVGAGHKKGISEYLLHKEIPEPESLLEVKERRFNLAKVLGYSILAIIILIFVAVLSSLNTQLILTAFFYWFMINGVLSAMGAAIAGAHPLSILAAFLFAWLTSLNPAIAAGWVSGLVEAWIRKPTSGDLERLSEAKTFRDLMKNKVFKVLMVVALTNIGSMIGTFLGIYVVLNLTGIDITGVLRSRISDLIGFIF